MKRFVLLLLPLLLLLTGCRTDSDISSYFALPQPTEEYKALSSLIGEKLLTGYEYAAPTAGVSRQSIQLRDLDGDGTEEAMVFLRSSSSGMAETLLCRRNGREWETVLTLSGAGTGVRSADTADLNGDGDDELILLYRTGAELDLLQVCSLTGWGGAVMLTAPCSDFLCTDLDSDGRTELSAMTLSGAEPGVTVYTFPKGSETLSVSAPLSAGIERCERFRTCSLSDGTPALLAESYLTEGELVSDLFTMLGGTLLNITMDSSQGVSHTVRSYAVPSADINGDGALEIPFPCALFNQSFTDSYRSLSWQGYTALGQYETKLETYHCYSDGWYLELPEQWSAMLTVRRSDDAPGERSVILSDIDRSTGEITDKLIIYTLSGENRSERSHLPGRFVIAEDDSVIYAGRILSGLTEEELAERFHLIYTEWIPGSL